MSSLRDKRLQIVYAETKNSKWRKIFDFRRGKQVVNNGVPDKRAEASLMGRGEAE